MTEFSNKEGWEDVIPVPQDDGPSPVVCIQYAPEYAELMGYFRAVLLSQEKSRRVLDLTSSLLEMNAGNYTVWQYRRECLAALPDALSQELSYLDTFSEENPKNYQIWYHRRAIVKLTGNPTSEKLFCDRIFQVDAKNYHAWAHRQWVVKEYNLWDGELEAIDILLEADVRNNSAWNHRWFVIHCHGTSVDEAVVYGELEFAWNLIDRAQLNESAWNYIRGYYRKYPFTSDSIKSRCLTLLTLGKSSPDRGDIFPEFVMWKNSFALCLLADVLASSKTVENLSEAARLYRLLQQHDPLRVKYWMKKERESEATLATL